VKTNFTNYQSYFELIKREKEETVNYHEIKDQYNGKFYFPGYLPVQNNMYTLNE